MIMYSTPGSIHRMLEVLSFAAVNRAAGTPPVSRIAVTVPSVPFLPFRPTQDLMTVWSWRMLTSGSSSYPSTSPCDVLYCSTTTLFALQIEVMIKHSRRVTMPACLAV